MAHLGHAHTHTILWQQGQKRKIASMPWNSVCVSALLWFFLVRFSICRVMCVCFRPCDGGCAVWRNKLQRLDQIPHTVWRNHTTQLKGTQTETKNKHIKARQHKMPVYLCLCFFIVVCRVFVVCLFLSVVWVWFCLPFRMNECSERQRQERASAKPTKPQNPHQSTQN
jgi:hypothetical protein